MTCSARWLPLLLAALTLPLSQMLFQGCATLANGPTEKVYVISHPEGARVLLNGRPIGLAPVTTTVSRWGSHRLRIDMPGYKPFEVPLQKKYHEAASGNILIGGVWIIVDVLTGAIFELDVPRDQHAELAPGPGEGTNFSTTALTISVALKPEPGARRIGQLERQ